MLDNFRDRLPNFRRDSFLSCPAPDMILHIGNHVGQFPRCPPNFQTQFLFSYPALNMILVIKNHAGQFPACRDDFHKGAFVSTCAQHDSVYWKSCWTISQNVLATFTRALSLQPALNMIRFIENHVGRFPVLPCQISKQGSFFQNLRSTWSCTSKIMLGSFPNFFAMTTFKQGPFFTFSTGTIWSIRKQGNFRLFFQHWTFPFRPTKVGAAAIQGFLL